MNRSGNRNRRNGGDRMPLSSARQSLHPPIENEPIMLEYLHNIDRELNELKKKREIIEQQHGYFHNQREDVHSLLEEEREFLYNTPRYYEQFYDDPEPSHSAYHPKPYEYPAQNDDYISLNSSRKRPNPWQNDYEIKRFSSFERDNVEKSFGSRLGPKPTSRYYSEQMNYNQSYGQSKNAAPSKRNAVPSQKPKPLMSYSMHDSFAPSRKEYKSKNKISKPKVSSARPPNKLNAYPVATRKALIEETTRSNACPVAIRNASVAPAKKADAKPVATQKASASPSKKADAYSVATQKASAGSSKQADAYPVATQKTSVGQTLKASEDNGDSMILLADGELTRKIRGRLELALGHILKSMKEQKTMEQNFNMQRIIKQIIRERLRNLMLGKRIGSYVEIVAAYRERFPLETDEKTLIAARGTVLSNIKYRKADSAEEFLKLNIDLVLEKKLQEMFLQLEEIYSGMKKSLKGTDQENKDAVATTCEDNDVVIIGEDDQDNCDIPAECKNFKFSVDDLESMLEEKLPNLLMSFVPHLTKIMKLDYRYESSIAEVVINTNGFKAYTNKLQKIAKIEAENLAGKNKNEIKSNVLEAKTSEEQTNTSPLYYLKLIGRPTLPKRKPMQSFLDKFKPTTIKKHKKQPNLLFVGFTDKKYYDHLLTRNGITFGKLTIEIKPSEPSKSNAPNAENETTGTDTKDIESSQRNNDTNDTSFDSELDDQINDLLSSIRQGEEENDSDTAEPTTAEILQTGCFDLEGNDRNRVTIIFDSDDEQNEEKSEKTDNTVEKTEDITENTEDVTDKTEDATDKTKDISEEMEDITEKTNVVPDKTEDIIDETEDVTEKTEDITEKTNVTEETEDVTEETEVVIEKTDDITENTDDVTKTTENITEKTEDVTENTDDVTEKTQDITENTVDVTEKTENITEKPENVTEKTEDIAEKSEDITEKTDDATKAIQDVDVVKVEGVIDEITSEFDTIDDTNVEQDKEQVAHDEKKQTNTENVEAVSMNEENPVQDDNVNVEKEVKKDVNVKESVRATPTRASSRLASVKPTTIQTRRASRMTQNNE